MNPRAFYYDACFSPKILSDTHFTILLSCNGKILWSRSGHHIVLVLSSWEKKKASADHLWDTTLFVVYFSPTMLSETYFSVLFGCKTILIVSSRLTDCFLFQYRRRVKTKHRSTHSTSPISRSIYQSGAAQCILVVFSTFWTKGNTKALFFCFLL